MDNSSNDIDRFITWVRDIEMIVIITIIIRTIITRIITVLDIKRNNLNYIDGHEK